MKRTNILGLIIMIVMPTADAIASLYCWFSSKYHNTDLALACTVISIVICIYVYLRAIKCSTNYKRLKKLRIYDCKSYKRKVVINDKHTIRASVKLHDSDNCYDLFYNTLYVNKNTVMMREVL